MKNVPNMLCKAIAYGIATPFLIIGFLIWLLFVDNEPCKGCPLPQDACSKCRANHEKK